DRPSRSAIPLGVPRTTRSLCPDCVIETRNAVLDGRTDINVLKRDPGVINAEISEEAGRVLMRKICQIHGRFEDVLATDAAFFRRMERLCPRPAFACTEYAPVHDPEFAQQARESGLHSVFLQLDGVSDENNRHRGVSNLFRVKQQAMENLANSGLRITLQVTVANGVNNDQVGPIVEFALRNVNKVFSVVFQPIMFTGRDEDVTDDRRYEQRYTLSQLAADLGSQMSTEWEPLRDWFPTAAISQFSDVLDLLQPSDSAVGSVAPNEHPDWGVMSPLIVNRRTGLWVPIARFFNLERFNRD